MTPSTPQPTLEALARSAGASLRDNGAGHWTLFHLERIVHYWPESKGRTATLALRPGAPVDVRRGLTPAQAVALVVGTSKRKLHAMTPPHKPSPKPKPAPPPADPATVAELLKLDPLCYWCGAMLDEATARADFRPDAFGRYTKKPADRVLSCAPCVARRESL